MLDDDSGSDLAQFTSGVAPPLSVELVHLEMDMASLAFVAPGRLCFECTEETDIRTFVGVVYFEDVGEVTG